MLGALVNLAKQITNRTLFIDSSGVQYLLPFLKSQVTAYYIKSLFCLAYLIEEDNNETIMANAGKNAMTFVLECLVVLTNFIFDFKKLYWTTVEEPSKLNNVFAMT